MSTAVFGALGFRARSGREVRAGEDGSVSFHLGNGYIGADVALDAEEFFEAKRDDELGRWRWPENPDYVVYRTDQYDGFMILDEREGKTWTYRWSAIKDDPVFDGPWDAARAYFAAHPERKPWQAAKVGEVWILSTADGETAAYAVMTVREAGTVFESHEGRYSLDDPDIEDARRIWPEDAS